MGLRDLTILRAISASWVADAPHQALDSPCRSALGRRDGLHTVTGRHGDKLTLQEQPPVAELLDDVDSDVLLRRVSSAGRAIAYVVMRPGTKLAVRPQSKRSQPRSAPSVEPT